jgi:oxygen-independent coproporphyrinogen-3 oxidase
MGAPHLYVHVPFCAYRCGYCDFVTVTGRPQHHAAYVEALLTELALERHELAAAPDTVYLGGGTPTLLAPPLLDRLLAGLPAADEVSVEANPETVTPELAAVLARRATRVSLGAQSFGAAQLSVLERRTTPAQVEAAVSRLRRAGVAELSLDLLFGVPGQDRAALDRDLDAALALEPDHLSCYELEAKPGTRFTHRHGAALRRQAERLEDHYEHVITRLEQAGYRWYETANFCRDGRRARHNLGYWEGRDYLGLGIGAVTTLGLRRWRDAPRLAPYLDALQAGRRPPRQPEALSTAERETERVMLGLRLDTGLALDGLEAALDADQVHRLAGLGLVREDGARLSLTRRGRMVANDVIATLLAA